jgi:uncharacterized membrane protein YczE
MEKIFLKYFCREYIIKTVMSIIGTFLIGLGVGVMRYSDLGIDPFMSLANGMYLTISKPLGISFGSSFLLFCLIVLAIVLIFDRSEIGLGTVITMTLCGYISEFGLFLCNLIATGETTSFFIRIIVMFFGIIIMAIGSGLYFTTRIGVSPYDAIGLAITTKIGNQKIYRLVRIGTDIICVSGGFFMGSIPGIGTIVMTFFTGPLFAFFRLHFLVLGKRIKIITW